MIATYKITSENVNTPIYIFGYLNSGGQIYNSITYCSEIIIDNTTHITENI